MSLSSTNYSQKPSARPFARHAESAYNAEPTSWSTPTVAEPILPESPAYSVWSDWKESSKPAYAYDFYTSNFSNAPARGSVYELPSDVAQQMADASLQHKRQASQHQASLQHKRQASQHQASLQHKRQATDYSRPAAYAASVSRPATYADVIAFPKPSIGTYHSKYSSHYT